MNVTLYHSRDFANVLKHLDMWNYPALAGWVQCNHKGPYKRELGGIKARGDMMMEQ